MSTIIKDDKMTKMADSVKPDAKSRVHLPKALVKEGITYHVYSNRAGQIILDPQVTIPASEAWLFKDREALAAVDRGMAESAKGRAKRRGSFSGYTK